MTTRPALLAVCALSLAWITSSGVPLYLGVKEEVDENRYLHRVESCTHPSCRWSVGEPVASKTETSFESTGTRTGAG